MGRKSVKYERTLFFLLLWSFFKVSTQLVCRYPTQFSKLTQIETYHHLKSSTWAGSPQSSLNDSSRSSILVMLSIFIWLCKALRFSLILLWAFTSCYDAWEKKHNCNILFRLRSSRVKGQDRLTSDAVSLLSLHTKERERKKEFLK